MALIDSPLYIRKSIATPFKESEHPRDESGEFTSGGGAKKVAEGKTSSENATMKKQASKKEHLPISEPDAKKYAETGEATAFRIHNGKKPLPKKSRSTWSGDEEDMGGVSGYANMSNALEDMLLGRNESVTGDNYTSQTLNPHIIVMFGKAIDGPGAEVVVPDPRIAAVFSQNEIQETANKLFQGKKRLDSSDIDKVADALQKLAAAPDRKRPNQARKRTSQEAAPEKPQSPEEKEPWQMPIAEYGDNYYMGKNDAGEDGHQRHRKVVAAAVAAGKPVPANVLSEYPDINKSLVQKSAENRTLSASPLCRKSADWKESEHPRADDGKFGTGGGSPKSPNRKPITFIPHHNERDDETTIMVDPKKIDESWKNVKDEYLPPSESGKSEVPGRRAGVEEFLKKEKPVEASRMILHEGEVSFIDGRHRMAVMRDRGESRMAVTVPKDQAAEFRKRFGVKSLRKSTQFDENKHNRDAGKFSSQQGAGAAPEKPTGTEHLMPSKIQLTPEMKVAYATDELKKRYGDKAIERVAALKTKYVSDPAKLTALQQIEAKLTAKPPEAPPPSESTPEFDLKPKIPQEMVAAVAKLDAFHDAAKTDKHDPEAVKEALAEMSAAMPVSKFRMVARQFGVNNTGNTKPEIADAIARKINGRREMLDRAKSPGLPSPLRKSLGTSPLYVRKAFVEADHPRADDGKFGSGGNSGNNPSTSVDKEKDADKIPSVAANDQPKETKMTRKEMTESGKAPEGNSILKIHGETHAVKEKLKARGWKWNAEKGYWWLELVQVHAQRVIDKDHAFLNGILKVNYDANDPKPAGHKGTQVTLNGVPMWTSKTYGEPKAPAAKSPPEDSHRVAAQDIYNLDQHGNYIPSKRIPGSSPEDRV